MDENIVIQLERQKAVTATFRRLDSAKKEKIYRAAWRLFQRKYMIEFLLMKLRLPQKFPKVPSSNILPIKKIS